METEQGEISIIRKGTINLSGKTIISDPCYKRGTWCMVSDLSVKPGMYETFIVKYQSDYGVRNAAVIAVHSDHIGTLGTDWKSHNGEVGVDSGQAGIFDDTIYPKDKDLIGENDYEDSLCEECRKLTLGDEQGGILSSKKGVVSSSGYGDGVYSLFLQYRDGKRVALMVNFGLSDVDSITNKLIQKITG